MSKETADPSKRRSLLKILWGRRWKKITIGIIIFIAVILILIPYGIRYGAKRMILARGGEEARIQDVDFNPFTGRLALSGVDIEVDREQHLRIADAEVRLSWWPLTQKRIRIDRVWLNDTEMTVETLPEGQFRLGGITAALLGGSQKEPKAAESSSWEVGAREVSINNTKVKLRTPDFKTTVHVNQWNIRRAFSWQPEETANVEFDGTIDGSRLLIKGEVTPFARDRRIAANLKLEKLDSAPFNRLIKDAGAEFSGAVTLDTDLVLTQKEDGAFTVAHDGGIRLENLILKTSDMGASAGNFNFVGSINASLPSSDKLPLKLDADGQFKATGLSVETRGNTYKENELSWKGTVAAVVEAQAKKMQAVLDGDLSSQKLEAVLSGSNLTLAQDGFRWNGKIQAHQAANDTGIDLDGRLAVAQLKADSEALRLLHGPLDWDGRVGLALPQNASFPTVTTEGKLAGGRFELALPAEEIKSRHDAIQWQGNIDYAVNEKGPRLRVDGNLNLDAVAFESPDAIAAEEKIDWAGSCDVELPQADRKLALLLDGKLDLGKLDLRLPTHRLNIDQERFSWQGPLAYGGQAQTVAPASGGATAQIGNLRISDASGRFLLLGASDISAESVEMIGSRGLRGGKLRIDAMQFIAPQRAKAGPLLGAGSISIDTFEADPENNIEMKAIVIDALQSLLSREKNGQWSFSEGLAALQPPPGEPPAQPKPKPSAGKGTAPQFRIGKLEIRGNSRIKFTDHTVEPAVNTEMALNTLEIEKLNSARPDSESPFKLAGKIGKYTDIDFNGSLKPFDERLSMDLAGKIADLELPPLSPYIVKAIGYKFASGQADVDLEMMINRGQMDGKTRFRFDQLRAKPVDEQTLKKLDIEQTVPMETALSLLRDKDGTIKLNVPISGDIADPKFSVGDAVNQALLKATTKASMTYLKYALGPYGIAIAAAEVAYMAASQAGGIRLEPVKFTPGTAEIAPDDQGYVAKLATILKDRPQAKIRVCGIAAQAADQAAILAQGSTAEPGKDAPSTQAPEEKPSANEAEEESFASTSASAGTAIAQLPPEQLEALAKARSMAIKDYLVEQHGVKDDRILLCHPEIDKTAEAKPRAEILF